MLQSPIGGKLQNAVISTQNLTRICSTERGVLQGLGATIMGRKLVDYIDGRRDPITVDWKPKMAIRPPMEIDPKDHKDHIRRFCVYVLLDGALLPQLPHGPPPTTAQVMKATRYVGKGAVSRPGDHIDKAFFHMQGTPWVGRLKYYC